MELAVGYTTFPDRQRAVSPESRYQASKIEAMCEARRLTLHKLVGDVESHPAPDLERPGLAHALELLATGEVTCLVVTSLKRLTTSPATLGTLIEWLDEHDARLVVIDIDLDSSTKQGRLAARALARVGGLERARFGERLSQVPEGATSQRAPPRRPAVADQPLLQRRIAAMRANGMTLQAIADRLNEDGIPTLRGGREWRPSSVQAATGYKRPRAARRARSRPRT
jgi:DNA invertase Pin-like site-specific DNA recombinase